MQCENKIKFPMRRWSISRNQLPNYHTEKTKTSTVLNNFSKTAQVTSMKKQFNPELDIKIKTKFTNMQVLNFSCTILVYLTIIICEYSPIITEPEANNCFSINTQVIIAKTKRKSIVKHENILLHQKRANNGQPFCLSR